MKASRAVLSTVLPVVAVLAVLAVAVGALVVLATPATATTATGTTVTGARAAHPLGNFTVNHYNGLRIGPDLVENLAVVDSAELPTLQARPSVDADRSGTVSDSERSAYGTARCAELASAQRLTVNGTATPWRVAESALTYEPGQGGLETTRLTCRLSAVATPLEATGTISFGDGYLADRIGWREITAVASGGVRLARSSVPGTSVSRELRAYPDGLLSSPLDQRTAELGVAPGTGSVAVTLPLVPDGPIADALAALDRTFTGLIGTDSLTLPLGLLAVLLATVLGAGHALIPGHGKTVMAAYLAGRRGRPRDALIVGATVTATHTLGVLVVGLLLSAFSALTGEGVLAWLGLASGLLISAVGVRLLLSAWRAYRTGEAPALGHGHGHGHFGHGHEHGHGHGHGHGHLGHGPGPLAEEGRTVALLEREGADPGEEAVRSPAGGTEARDEEAARTGSEKAPSKGGLVGMGVAGGLVPSPSALVVLLGAIALGRTWFGIALVLAYGVGMAGTLTATGLLLVRLTGRLDRLATAGGGLAARVSALAPVGTAAVVVLLGLGLALRSLTGSL
ncbi:High-affinity nickel-transporter [Streptosporangium sp. NBC_01469]|uniref:High-affinity nickel-transporter n=1 Tax=Streptosporangium sp. NBC_01469 TaxID=2903898 RepID=UPI002E289342|nr:High-affinity nickel-transporter [Streptosporangium sp. NBC_01469]